MNPSLDKLKESIEQVDRDLNDVIPHFWERSIGDHYFGQFSMAVLKGRNEIEDRSQVEVERGLVFCGVYDGHGGTSASTYAFDTLYNRFCELSKRSVSGNKLRRAILDTENGLVHLVQLEFISNCDKFMATHGSSCLIGVITGGILHYANVGDSRAVLCCVDASGNLVAHQLTQDHNVNVKEVRDEYIESHPGNDPLLVKVNGMWHIKGIIQVTRSIGDGCFKDQDLAFYYGDYNLPGYTIWPLLSSDPYVGSVELEPHHRFVIFASKGLWEHLTNSEAAEEVHNGPRQGAARRLIKRALRTKASRAGMSYEALKAVSIENRRNYLDDISVIVLFIDYKSTQDATAVPQLSVKAPFDVAGPSNSNYQEGN